MPNIMIPFSAQLVADNTDVFSGDVNAQMPSYFQPKFLRVQVVFSDTDALHSLNVGGIQFSESSGPHIAGADNVQSPNWQAPHYKIPVPAGRTDFSIVLDHNAVTGGVGLAMCQWED